MCSRSRRYSPRRRGLTLAIREGAFAAVFVELTGGAHQIGLLSALPFLA